MQNKVYIWGFPGLGKSSIRSELYIEDADCSYFKFHFPEGRPDRLHGAGERAGSVPDPAYPQNYLKHIDASDADVVLLNCHISLLEHFDKERLLLIHPTSALKEEYLERYRRRGDHKSYISYMEESFDDILSAIKDSPYRTYEISRPNVYLQDLLEGGQIMNQFITKKELTVLLDDCIQHGIYTPDQSAAEKAPAELAQMLFEGELSIDIDALRKALDVKKRALEQEQLLSTRRGGLTHKELTDKIMEGIVNGALFIRHDEIAPYSHGYEVLFGGDRWTNYDNRWECYCPLSEVAETIVKRIEADTQSRECFSSNQLSPIDIHAILTAIDAMEKEKITSFVEESKAGLEPRRGYSGHVANVNDVHRGLALDGIILGHFSGTYSTMTTSMQNDLVKTMVALKGFCLDCLDLIPHRDREFVVDYLKAHGTDVSTPEKLTNWIKANPEKCGAYQNRKRKPSLADRIEAAEAKSPVTHSASGKEKTPEMEH